MIDHALLILLSEEWMGGGSRGEEMGGKERKEGKLWPDCKINFKKEKKSSILKTNTNKVASLAIPPTPCPKLMAYPPE